MGNGMGSLQVVGVQRSAALGFGTVEIIAPRPTVKVILRTPAEKKAAAEGGDSEAPKETEGTATTAKSELSEIEKSIKKQRKLLKQIEGLQKNLEGRGRQAGDHPRDETGGATLETARATPETLDKIHVCATGSKTLIKELKPRVTITNQRLDKLV